METDHYTLTYSIHRPQHITMTFASGLGAELFVASGCDRDELIDELVALDPPRVEEGEGATRLVFCFGRAGWTITLGSGAGVASVGVSSVGAACCFTGFRSFMSGELGRWMTTRCM